MLKLTLRFDSDSFTSLSFLSYYPHVPLRIFRRYTQPMSVRMEQSQCPREKVVVVLGATGCGKSRLSVDLATRFPAEIINSDKIQVYDALKITTNQITDPERCGVPHHIIGQLNPDEGELTAGMFRSTADRSISDIVSRGKLPILAGGSNSYIHALLADRFDPEVDPFSESGSICSELRYDCCFLWIDVSLPVLYEYLAKRVDEMIELGMFEELAEFYDPSKYGSQIGVWKAIGVPESDRFFQMYPPEKTNQQNRNQWDPEKKAAFERAIQEIKENTYRLAERQIWKILNLKSSGWEITRLDATASFEAVLGRRSQSSREEEGVSWRDIWDKEILKTSMKIVKRFMED